MDAGLERFFRELAIFFAPLRRAVAAPEQLALFLARFGYALDGADRDLALAELGPLGAALEAFGDAVAALPPSGEVGPGDLAALTPPAAAILASVADLRTAGAVLAALGIDDQLAADILHALAFDYLNRRVPPLIGVLIAVEAVVISQVPAGSRPVPHVAVRFDLDRLRQLVVDFDGWAREVYGWGVAFDHQKALVRLAALADRIGPPPYLHPMTQEQLAALRPGHPPDVPPPAMVFLPLLDRAADGPAGIAEAEIGIVVLPAGDPADPAAGGLGIAPYSVGTLTGEHQVSPLITLQAVVDAAATGGAVVVVDPDGVRIAGGTAVEAEFQLGLRIGGPAGAPVRLIGTADGTRVELDALHAAAGGSLDGDVFVAVGITGLAAHVDLSADGLLGALLTGPVTVRLDGVLLGWRPGRGVYVEGGSGLAVSIPVAIALGPLTVTELGMALELDDRAALAVTASGSLALGPLTAVFEGLGVRVRPADGPLRPTPDGVELSLVLPAAYGVALDGGPISGGGFLSVADTEYRGALALRFESLGFSAFAILTTTLPGGRDGFSFVGVIFGEFVIPLGYGFFLTGLGGIIGINRTTNSDALRAAVTAGSLDHLLFPADPIGQAPRILDDLASVFPAKEGQHVFGPVARIAFGQPPLIEGKIGLLLEVGAQIRVLILGVLGSDLPTRDLALVSLRVSFVGIVDLAARTISLDASLAGSRVLDFAISGDMAARTGWAPRIDHVISFGGLHPAYPRPSNLPELRRLSINFGSNNPRVTLSAYLAVTTSSLQFGARASMYAKGPKVTFVGRLAAEGELSLDAIVYFDPFGFDAKLIGSLSLLVDGDVVLGLGFNLRLSGPNPITVAGRVWATVFGFDVGFGINHSWGERRAVAPPLVDPVAVLRTGLLSGSGFEPVVSTRRVSGVTFAPDPPGAAPAVDPAAGLRYLQRALPLGIPIEKVGEAVVAGGARRFDLAVRGPDGDDLQLDPVDADFVRGQHWTLTEDERLRAPVFEAHQAGFTLGGDELVADAGTAVDAEYAYEVIVLQGTDTRDPAGLRPGFRLDEQVAGRWSAAHRREVARPLTPEAVAGVGERPVRVVAGGYVGLADVAAPAAPLSAVLAGMPGRGRTAVANPAVAGYVAAAAAEVLA